MYDPSQTIEYETVFTSDWIFLVSVQGISYSFGFHLIGNYSRWTNLFKRRSKYYDPRIDYTTCRENTLMGNVTCQYKHFNLS